MTIKRVRETVPKELPVARLFLDDIKAIQDLVNEELEKLADKADSPVTVSYLVNKKTECDTLDDLKQLGGEAQYFDLEVQRKINYSRFSTSLTVSSSNLFSSNLFFASGLPEETHWALYARVESIFAARRIWLRYVFDMLPPFAQGALFMAGCISGTWALVIFAALIADLIRHIPHPSFYLPVAIPLAIFPVLISPAMRKSRVYLYYRHDVQREKRSRRRALIYDIAKMVIGAALGIVGTLIAQLALRKR